MKENPFQYGKPVRDPRNFFGWKEEIKSIYRQILALNSISLIGERKIGKTSLLLYLVHPQTLARYRIPENILMFYIDISSCSFFRSSDVFRRFLECISEKTTGKVKEETENLLKKDHLHFQQFEDIIAKINDNNQKIIFLLDEFESISMVKQGDIFSKLRYLAQMYDVVFVISTVRDLRSLFREERFSTSPFFNIFTKYQLHGLDERASRELITVNFERVGREIDPTVVDSIIRFSGNNPFFLKLTCYFYFEMAINGKKYFDNDLKASIQSKLEPYHRYNWEHLPRDEQAALLEIIKNENTNDPFAELSLERKGYIAKGKDGLYITSESFHNYLKAILDSRSSALDNFKIQIVEIGVQQNLTRSDRKALREAVTRIEGQKLFLDELGPPVFDIIGYFELEMRRYIKKVLEVALGTDWFKHAMDRKSRKEIEERILSEKKRSADFRYPENPLDYAPLENLGDLVSRRDSWDHYFSRYFEDKRALDVKMKEIIDIRNRIAHFHPIHFNEAATVIQNVLWMLTRMRKQV